MNRILPQRLRWGIASVAVVAYAVIPLAWLVSLSLKPPADLADGRLFPRRASVESYLAIARDQEFAAALRNSIGIAGFAAVLAVVLAVLAAYAVVRLDFPGRGAVLGASLVIAMFPPVSIVGPLFDLWRRTGLYDTWLGLILPYTALALPLAIWSLSAYLREIPWELERAARVDGASRLQAFRLVIVPLAAPGVVTAGVLSFVFAWNEFLFAISLTSTDRARTVPAALAFFSGESQFQLPVGTIAAAAVVVTLPVVALVLAFQRRIVAGLTAGAVKG